MKLRILWVERFSHENTPEGVDDRTIEHVIHTHRLPFILLQGLARELGNLLFRL